MGIQLALADGLRHDNAKLVRTWRDCEVVFNITPPLATPPGSYLLEGELVLAAHGLPVQTMTYRQLVNVQ